MGCLLLRLVGSGLQKVMSSLVWCLQIGSALDLGWAHY
ncbi:hypothetical protein SynBIOSU31_01234 [Synechococcus sp. BIOS-U3-1]|nr:hypothetical protein SynBIOSU31_01234 [Synechococcus sp. BIOS-U3-1]